MPAKRAMPTETETKFGAAKAKVAGLLEVTKVEVLATKDKVIEKYQGATSTASEYVKGAKQRLVGAAEPVISKAQTVKTSALHYALSAKEAAFGSYKQLRNNGLKAWSLELAKTSGKAIAYARSRAAANYSDALSRTSEILDSTQQGARRVATTAADRTVELKAKTIEVAKDGKFQATAAGAVSGAATLGASGAVTGVLSGGAIGAVVGLVPALFTFGLSIPIGAAIGGGTGLVVGTAVGSTAGAVGGGAAGRAIHNNRGEIKEGAQQISAKVSAGAASVKGKAVASADYMKGKVGEVRTRLVKGSSTGGTESRD